jgi:o-succinylbenzoate synthase
MKLEAIELHHLTIPLVSKFTTSFGTQHARSVLLVKAVTSQAEGWAECVSIIDPVYTSEHVDGAALVIRRYLAPKLLGQENVDVNRIGHDLAFVVGHRMAKAAVETAVLDAFLRESGMSLATFLGGTRDEVACGVSVGIADSIDALLSQVAGHLESGYLRIKLKIRPGWDIEPVRAVRDAFGPHLLLSVDANTSYDASTLRSLIELDEFDLLMIEQPFIAEDIDAHARLASRIKTAVCLDESIVSAANTASAIAHGACSIVNIKPGRVGGYLESRRIHDVCAAMGVPVWCGGMLETGVGRAANVALASLPNFTLPNDTSASARYFETDITEPFELRDGYLRVPTGPGIGVEVAADALALYEVSSEVITAH